MRTCQKMRRRCADSDSAVTLTSLMALHCSVQLGPMHWIENLTGSLVRTILKLRKSWNSCEDSL